MSVFLVERKGGGIDSKREYNGTDEGAWYLRPDQAETIGETDTDPWYRSGQETCCETLQ